MISYKEGITNFGRKQSVGGTKQCWNSSWGCWSENTGANHLILKLLLFIETSEPFKGALTRFVMHRRKGTSQRATPRLPGAGDCSNMGKVYSVGRDNVAPTSANPFLPLVFLLALSRRASRSAPPSTARMEQQVKQHCQLPVCQYCLNKGIAILYIINDPSILFLVKHGIKRRAAASEKIAWGRCPPGQCLALGAPRSTFIG